MRLIDTHQLEALYEQARHSARLRAHLLMHNSHQDKVQRLLIALIQGSYVDPHFHELPHQWEMFIVIQGQVQVCLYGKDGEIINQFVAGENTAINVVEFSPGDIHSVECLSPRALMMEVKEGPFDPSFAKAFI